MNCQQARKWISPYLDSELDPSTTFEVSQHLERCQACRARFEQEVQAEQLIAERLRDCPQYIDWAALHDRVFSPGGGRGAIFKLFRPRWALAAAACVAFLIIGFGDWSRPILAQWAVDELHRLSPDCKALTSGPDCNTDVVGVCQEVLNTQIQLPIDKGRIEGHPTRIINAARRSCPNSKCRLEVLLNCCGKPVLLNIGQAGQMGELQDVVDVLDKNPNGFITVKCMKYNQTYHIAARRSGNFVIVGVSPHRVDHIVQSINMVAINSKLLKPACPKENDHAAPTGP